MRITRITLERIEEICKAVSHKTGRKVIAVDGGHQAIIKYADTKELIARVYYADGEIWFPKPVVVQVFEEELANSLRDLGDLEPINVNPETYDDIYDDLV